MQNEKLTRTITSLLSALSDSRNEQIAKYLKLGQAIQLFSGKSKLLEINEGSIALCGEDTAAKITAKKEKLDIELSNEKWKEFLAELGSSLLGLNHLGISYACDDINAEIQYYKQLAASCNFALCEEQSDDPNTRWLFLGDKSDWQSPLFEIVLNANLKKPEDQWRPHFQIDIDTSLSQTEIETVLTKYFGKDFIQWKLDIQDYGTVLDMGMLCSINGTKIYFGIGTNLRDTRYHRANVLKRL